MERIRYVQHRGRQILVQDFSNIDDHDAALETIEAAKRTVAEREEDGSLLVLTVGHGSRYDKRMLNALKELAAHHTPYVRASAVVTDSGLHRVAIYAVSRFAGRNIKAFDGEEAAKDWLVEQAE